MKNKFIVTGALALSLVTGGLTAFAATDATVNPAPVSVTNVTVTAPAAKPAMKKVVKKAMPAVAKKPTAKKAMPATAKKPTTKKKVVKASAAVAAPAAPATN